MYDSECLSISSQQNSSTVLRNPVTFFYFPIGNVNNFGWAQSSTIFVPAISMGPSICLLPPFTSVPPIQVPHIVLHGSHPSEMVRNSSNENLSEQTSTDQILSPGESPLKYQCEVCGKRFHYQSAYASHAVVHTREKKFKCEICGYSFAHKSTLTVHLRVHTQDRPYSCKVCQQTFPHRTSLHRHLRTHTGEKPFPCQICSRTFRDQSTLTRHLRTHTGDKPFGCTQCDASFSQKSHLNRHITKKHSVSCRV